MADKQNTTQNIIAPNHDLEILKKNFSHCFDKNGDFNFEKFKKELESNEINFSKESYGMDWLGKSYARLLATDPAKTLIKENTDWNEKPENKNSENLLIKGDNLEVLKHLSNAYHEKVKMIYIDPPYNTGSDGFAYADDRKFTVEQFQELQKSVKILGKIIQQKALTDEESSGLLQIISNYAYALDILDQYDYQTLAIESTSGREIYQVSYSEAIAQIQLVKEKYGNSDLFGKEKDESFMSSISTIYQTFEGGDLYPSIEEKAANLLYLVTKNHSFIDGNKRIAAFLFLYFMEKNHILYDENGRKRIADNALVALTLMIAVSNTEEKDTITKVIVSLINKNN